MIPILEAQGVRFADLIAKLDSFHDNMALTRKVLRFGVPLTLLNNVIKRFRQHERRGVTMIFWRTLQDCCTALYFITDHPLYLNKLGLIELNKA